MSREVSEVCHACHGSRRVAQSTGVSDCPVCAATGTVTVLAPDAARSDRRVNSDFNRAEINMLINLLDIEIERGELEAARRGVDKPVGYGAIAERVRDRLWDDAYGDEQRNEDWENAVSDGAMDETFVEDDPDVRT